MQQHRTTPKQQNDNSNYVKSAAWLVEATFRVFVAYVLFKRVDHNFFTIVAGSYAALTATLVVGLHFIKAHK